MIGLLTTHTTAHLDAGVVLASGGDLTVTATDATNLVAVAGAVSASKQVGAGISVGFNGVDRETRAYIGRENADQLPTLGSGGTMSVDGAVKIEATVSGQLLSIVLGGAIAGVGDNPPAQKGTTPASGGADLTVGIAVSVAVNSVTKNTVDAHLDNVTVTGTPDSLTVKASASPTILAIVIGLAVAIQKSSANAKPSVGGFSLDLTIAGAVAVNDVHTTVLAFVSDSSITTTGADGVKITATDESGVEVDAGGVAITLQLGTKTGTAVGAAVGISVGVNVLNGEVRAIVERSTVTAEKGDVVIDAVSKPRIVVRTIAGALAASTGGGGPGGKNFSLAGAGAGSGNSITYNVEAAVKQSSHVEAEKGGVRVSVHDTSYIEADSGGFAFSLAKSSGSSFASIAIGLSAARNEIRNTLTATVDNSIVTAGGTLSGAFDGALLSAMSEPTIKALTIAGAAATGAGSGAGSGNHIDNLTTAAVVNAATVEAQAGGVTVTASDAASITADAGGVSIAATLNKDSNGGVSAAVAIGVGIAVNEIGTAGDGDQVLARIADSTVTARGPPSGVTVSASMSATITALTFGIAVSVLQAGDGTGIDFAGALGGSFNTIRNSHTTASVESAAASTHPTVVNADAVVSVLATDTSKVTADGGGFGVALKLGDANGVNAAIGVGVSINEIGSLGTTVKYDGVRTTVSGPRTTVSGPGTTVTGAGQVLPGSTLAVASVAAFANSGTFTVAGVVGTCTYTGRDTANNRFTGVAGCTGAPLNGAVVHGALPGNLSVASVAAFANSGTFTVAGVLGTCTYTGRDTANNRLTGVSGCTGAPLDGAGSSAPPRRSRVAETSPSPRWPPSPTAAASPSTAS